MTQQQIAAAVLDVVRDVQKLSGRTWKGLRDDEKPIGDLDEFDSLLGVEATVLIENKIGFRLNLNTVFVSADGKRALTVREIAARIDTELREGRGERVQRK